MFNQDGSLVETPLMKKITRLNQLAEKAGFVLGLGVGIIVGLCIPMIVHYFR